MFVNGFIRISAFIHFFKFLSGQCAAGFTKEEENSCVSIL